MNLTIDGRQVQYLDKGEGPTLLFLHGWAAPVETYRLLTDHLSGYCRVVAPRFPRLRRQRGAARPLGRGRLCGFHPEICRRPGHRAGPF